MQRVRVVQWSLDNKYIISGSDEMNIRVWKARASEKLGMVRINNRINGGFKHQYQYCQCGVWLENLVSTAMSLG